MKPIADEIKLLAIEKLRLGIFPVTSPLNIFLRVSSLAYLGVSIAIVFLLLQNSSNFKCG